MSEAFLIQDDNGIFHCFWGVQDDVFAVASSKDLINWTRQSYIQAMKNVAKNESGKPIIQNIKVSKKQENIPFIGK